MKKDPWEIELPIYKIIALILKFMALGTYLGIELQKDFPEWWYKGTVAISTFLIIYLFETFILDSWWRRRRKKMAEIENFLNDNNNGKEQES
jgi:amino acid transporter